MPFAKIDISEFLELKHRAPLLDVRSPSEYEQAHIPGALSFPLFTDEERKAIGTAYKQQSRETAIKLGLQAFGKDLLRMVEAVEKILAERNSPTREVGLHCWRGGMRSAAVAWLLDFYGFKVYSLSGGYKSYRRWVRQQFEQPYRFRVIGGYTGSNKTGLIQQLKKQGETAIDLEALAGHKGSAFGNLHRRPQPTQEMFENLLAAELYKVNNSPGSIWLEDESQRIGLLNVPSSLFKTMRESPFIFLDVPFEARLQQLVQEYGDYEKELFISAILRIKKRLGGIEAKQAVNFLMEDNVKDCFAILLQYYDRLYLRSRLQHEEQSRMIRIERTTTSAGDNAAALIHHVQS